MDYEYVKRRYLITEEEYNVIADFVSQMRMIGYYDASIEALLSLVDDKYRIPLRDNMFPFGSTPIKKHLPTSKRL